MFFIGLFRFLVIFSQVISGSAHNVKNGVLTFRTELEKRDDKSRTKLFTLSKKTFLSQSRHVSKRVFYLRLSYYLELLYKGSQKQKNV